MRVPQVNFSKGEISPHLYARFDVSAYSAAVKKGTNVCVLKYGGLTKRPGTRLVCEAIDSSKPTRGFPFQFSLEQAYILEFGHGTMRALALGGAVLFEELIIQGISNAVNAQVSINYHGYSVGDQVWLTDIAAPMTSLNNRFFTVQSVVDANRFTIDADTSAMGAFTSAVGGITRTGAPDPDPVPPSVYEPVSEPDIPDLGGFDFKNSFGWY